jgi:hypothetical protein
VLVAIEGTCNKQLLVVIDNMITQHLKLVALKHIATKMNGRVLVYHNEVKMILDFQLFSLVENITNNN